MHPLDFQLKQSHKLQYHGSLQIYEVKFVVIAMSSISESQIHLLYIMRLDCHSFTFKEVDFTFASSPDSLVCLMGKTYRKLLKQRSVMCATGIRRVNTSSGRLHFVEQQQT